MNEPEVSMAPTTGIPGTPKAFPPPLTSPTVLAAATPGEVVTVVMASPLTMLQPEKIVASKVAPEVGPIPAGQMTAVVRVKDWFNSTEIWTTLALLAGAALDTMVEDFVMANGEINLRKVLMRGLLAAGLAYLGIRRGTSNSVIRSLPIVSPPKEPEHP